MQKEKNWRSVENLKSDILHPVLGFIHSILLLPLPHVFVTIMTIHVDFEMKSIKIKILLSNIILPLTNSLLIYNHNKLCLSYLPPSHTLIPLTDNHAI